MNLNLPKTTYSLFRFSFARNDRSPLVLLSLFWLAWLTLPYLFAWLWGQWNNWQFMGFLFNPQDGLSYLTKIEQGRRGAWCYTSPFDPYAVCQPIFLYYLLLGHLARALSWSSQVMYQTARVANGLTLAFILSTGLRTRIPRAAQPLAFGLILFGAGMGWLVLPWTLPALPPDFNLADAFPYLNAIGMPHFLLTHTLVFLYWFWGFPRLWSRGTGTGWVVALVLGTSLFSPFAALLMAGTPFVANGLRGQWKPRRDWLLVLLAALAYPLLLSWTLRSTPSWSAWTGQNIMLSPSLGMLLLALMPALVWALYAFVTTSESALASQADLLTVLRAWLLLALTLGYLPWLALQRRFLVAVYADVALAAALGWHAWATSHPWWARRAHAMLLITSLPTLGLNLMGYAWSAQTQPDVFYLSQSEVEALRWIRDHEIQGLWLSHPETGLRLAALADQQALVGHPIETPGYTDRARITRAWLCDNRRPTALDTPVVPTWVWVGPREQSWCNNALPWHDGLHCFLEEICLYKLDNTTEAARIQSENSRR